MQCSLPRCGLILPAAHRASIQPTVFRALHSIASTKQCIHSSFWFSAGALSAAAKKSRANHQGGKAGHGQHRKWCQARGLTSDDKGEEEHGVEVAPSLTQLGVAVVGLASTRTRCPPAPQAIFRGVTSQQRYMCLQADCDYAAMLTGSSLAIG